MSQEPPCRWTEPWAPKGGTPNRSWRYTRPGRYSPTSGNCPDRRKPVKFRNGIPDLVGGPSSGGCSSIMTACPVELIESRFPRRGGGLQPVDQGGSGKGAVWQSLLMGCGR